MFFLLSLVFFIHLCCFNSSNITHSKQDIMLTNENVLVLKGEINNKLASTFIYDLNKKEKKKDIFVYIDTNGGSVDAGNKIVSEISKYNLNCIASTAISMGFVILQSCNKRYVTDYSTLMQHQMSYGIMNEKEKIENYVNYIRQMDNKLTYMQSKKIGIESSKFKKKTFNDWWLFGENSIYENCADELIDVSCSPKLTNENYTIENGMYTYTYSKCPLVTDYLTKKKNKNKEEFIFYY